MTQFYAKLANHERKVDALRAAQLELLGKGVPPYYWASFQVVGDPNGTL
jgi:CHAT domain-containing protein